MIIVFQGGLDFCWICPKGSDSAVISPLLAAASSGTSVTAAEFISLLSCRHKVRYDFPPRTWDKWPNNEWTGFEQQPVGRYSDMPLKSQW